MGFHIDEQGKIHMTGRSQSHPVTPRQSAPPPRPYYPPRNYRRSNDFSFGLALLGLIVGGVVGYLLITVTEMLRFVFLNSIPDFYLLPSMQHMIFTGRPLTKPIIITAITFASAGFFLNGFERSREKFSMPYGALGLLFGGLEGIVLCLFILIFSEITGSMIELRTLILLISICSIFGFIWNGIGSSRETFSMHRSFLGVFCGAFFGVFISGAFVFSGCGWVIAAVILWPITLSIAGIVTIVYSVKGFITYGKGGSWDDM